MTKKLLTTILALAAPVLAQTTIKDSLAKHWKAILSARLVKRFASRKMSARTHWSRSRAKRRP